MLMRTLPLQGQRPVTELPLNQGELSKGRGALAGRPAVNQFCWAAWWRSGARGRKDGGRNRAPRGLAFLLELEILFQM